MCLFSDRVAQAATAARRNRERFAVMVLDLDAFKKVNDSLGHSQGNELLKIWASGWSSRPATSTPSPGSAATTSPCCCRVRQRRHLRGHRREAARRRSSTDRARRPRTVHDRECRHRLLSRGRDEAEHLLRNADSAMHRAKEMGRDTFRAYASGMNDLAQLRLVRESELHNAIAAQRAPSPLSTPDRPARTAASSASKRSCAGNIQCSD